MRRSVVGLVVPTGYSFNLDGSTLYLAAASIFVAQAAGIHFSLTQQLLLMGTLMLTSNGHTVLGAINKGLAFDPVKNFTAVTQVASMPGILVVPPDSPSS